MPGLSTIPEAEVPIGSDDAATAATWRKFATAANVCLING